MTTASLSVVFFCILVAFLIGFLLIWCFVVWLISHLSGWQRLAKHYSAGDRPVTGTTYRGFRGLVGIAHYRYVLTLHVNDDSFFMEISPLFRLGHACLCIPWSEVRSQTPHFTPWWKAERLHIGDPVVGTITLPVELLDRIATEPGAFGGKTRS